MDQTTEWPEWARVLIATYGEYGNAATSIIGVPPEIFDYIVARMKRERLDAMLDAEIGQ